MNTRFLLTAALPFLIKTAILLIAMAFWLWFRSRGRTIAEAGTCAAMGAHAVCSMGMNAQIAPVDSRLALLVFGGAVVLGFLSVRRHPRIAGETMRHWIRFIRKFPLPAAILTVVVLFRGGWALCMGGHWIPMEGSAGILFQPLPGCWADAYAGMAPFLGYAGIVLGTYALSRRHAWPPVAMTATLVIGCMPRLSSPMGAWGFELAAGGYALLAMVALYRLLEDPRIDDLLFWIVGWICSWTPVPLGWLLPMVLIGLSLVLVHHRHGLKFLGYFTAAHKWLVLGTFGVSVMISPLWYQIHHVGLHSLFPGFRYNSDGLQGAFHNLVRYCLQAAHLGAVGNSAVRPVGLWWQKMLEGVPEAIQHVVRLKPESARFSLAGTGYGFGPLGVILVLPATLYSLFFGSKRLRTAAVAAGWYWFLLILIPDWTPERIYLLTPLMTVFGFLVAFFLPPWRFSRTGHRVLHFFCFLMWVYGCLEIGG